MLGPIAMRLLAAVLLLCLPVADALAGEQGSSGGGGGGHSGGGRLGQVSGGMHGGGGGGGSSGGGGGAPRPPREDYGAEPIVDSPRVIVATGGGAVIVRSRPPARPRYDGGAAKVEVYLAAQKVYESDGSWTAEVAIRDGLFRLGGSITRYYERQADDSTLTLSVPALIGGIRVDDGGPTRVYLEAGFAGAKTNHDPVMDTSVAGAVAGVRLEHRLANHTAVTAEIHEMIFEDDLRAHSVRLGLQLGIVQASVRMLDMNVGPALYGPELGLKF